MSKAGFVAWNGWGEGSGEGRRGGWSGMVGMREGA